MGSFLQVLGGAATGFLMSGGNPLGAVLGGVSAGATGSANPITGAGNVSNTAWSAFESGILGQQQLDNMKNSLFQLQMSEQASAFNNMIDEKSELMREGNVLREVAMEQRKADISITREFIRSIG
jgi:hypothetical protein